MVGIKNFKKGDFFVYTEINNDNIISDRNLIAYYITNTRIIFGTYKKYSDFKYYFELSPDELINAEITTKEEMVKKYENYDIEIHKYKCVKDLYWHDYSRIKKDYNWRYEIALGINKKFACTKRDLIKSYYEDLEIANKCGSKVTIKYMEEACRNLMNEIECKMSCHSSFNISNGGLFNGITINKNVDYYCVMLKNYSQLKNKYERKVTSDVYSMLLDFENNINQAIECSILTNIEIEIVKLMMEDKTKSNDIVDYLNANFKLKKPLRNKDIIFNQDISIPKKLYNMCNIEESEEKRNG